MTTFLITYDGGGEMPADPEMRAQMMVAFGAWVASVRSNMVDPGRSARPRESRDEPRRP